MNSTWRKACWDFGTLLKIPPPPILYLVVLAAYIVSKDNVEAGRATFEKTVTACCHEGGEDGKRETATDLLGLVYENGERLLVLVYENGERNVC